jgi:hypothetical protein
MILRTGRAVVVTRRSGVLIAALVAAVFAVFGYTIWLTATHVSARAALEASLDVILILPFVVVGAILIWKRSAGLIGWLLVGCGAGIALTSAVTAYVDIALSVASGQLPADLRLVLLGNPISVVALGCGLVLLPLLFPDGSPLTRRWRVVVRVAIAAMMASVLTGPFAETDLRVYPAGEKVELGANPFAAWPGAGLLRAVAAVAFVTLLLLVPVAFASLVHRYWQGTLEQRLQIRWVVAAAGTFVAMFAFLLGSEFVFGLALPELLWDVLLGSAVALIPVAIGVAIMRYRLYDIDRVLSRTVAYTLLTLMLIGVYGAGVVVFGEILRAVVGGRGGDLVVAASTLAVAALFGPLRRRVQTMVDRRFDRAHSDRQATIASFTERMRDEVGLEALASEVRETAVRAVQPTQGSLWLAVKEPR